MKRFLKLMSKPRNIYFSFVALLTIVMGLMSISFSFYIDESRNRTKLVELSLVNNKMTSEHLIDNKIVIPAGEKVEFYIDVTSYNDFESAYTLTYKADKNVKIYITEGYAKTIGAYETQKVKIAITNQEKEASEVTLDILNYYANTKVEIQNAIEEKNA